MSQPQGAAPGGEAETAAAAVKGVTAATAATAATAPRPTASPVASATAVPAAQAAAAALAAPAGMAAPAVTAATEQPSPSLTRPGTTHPESPLIPAAARAEGEDKAASAARAASPEAAEVVEAAVTSSRVVLVATGTRGKPAPTGRAEHTVAPARRGRPATPALLIMFKPVPILVVAVTATAAADTTEAMTAE